MGKFGKTLGALVLALTVLGGCSTTSGAVTGGVVGAVLGGPVGAVGGAVAGGAIGRYHPM